MQTARGLAAALGDLVKALRRVKAEFMIIGGVAVQARGYARATRDVDAAVRADQVSLATLTKALTQSHIEPRIPDYEAMAAEGFMLLLEHRPTGTPIDLGLAWVDFEHAACARATLETFGRVKAPVICLEDLLVLKVLAWRDRDQNDVRNLLSLHAEVDTAAVAAQVGAIAQVMELDDRVDAFSRLVAQVRGGGPGPSQKPRGDSVKAPKRPRPRR